MPARKKKTVVSTGCGEYTGFTSSAPIRFHSPGTRSWTSKKREKRSSSIRINAASFFCTLARTVGYRVVLQPPVGPHQGRETGEMVVVRMGVEYSLDLRRADAQRIEGPRDVRAGVHEVEQPAAADDAPHARSGDVPAVPFPDVDHGKDVPARAAGGEGVGGSNSSPGPRVRSTSTDLPAAMNS